MNKAAIKTKNNVEQIIDDIKERDAFNEILGKVVDKFANRERKDAQDSILLPSV